MVSFRQITYLVERGNIVFQLNKFKLLKFLQLGE